MDDCNLHKLEPKQRRRRRALLSLVSCSVIFLRYCQWWEAPVFSSLPHAYEEGTLNLTLLAWSSTTQNSRSSRWRKSFLESKSKNCPHLNRTKLRFTGWTRVMLVRSRGERRGLRAGVGAADECAGRARRRLLGFLPPVRDHEPRRHLRAQYDQLCQVRARIKSGVVALNNLPTCRQLCLG